MFTSLLKLQPHWTTTPVAIDTYLADPKGITSTLLFPELSPAQKAIQEHSGNIGPYVLKSREHYIQQKLIIDQHRGEQ